MDRPPIQLDPTVNPRPSVLLFLRFRQPPGQHHADQRVDGSHTGTDHGLAIDDVSVAYAVAAATPAITIGGGTSATATAFTTTYGTASAAQTFPIAGSNLTAAITVAAVTG
ncbi:MAG: hypothetical protein ACKO3H_13720, partial [Verrucomicrobiota bacterium]